MEGRPGGVDCLPPLPPAQRSKRRGKELGGGKGQSEKASQKATTPKKSTSKKHVSASKQASKRPLQRGKKRCMHAGPDRPADKGKQGRRNNNNNKKKNKGDASADSAALLWFALLSICDGGGKERRPSKEREGAGQIPPLSLLARLMATVSVFQAAVKGLFFSLKKVYTQKATKVDEEWVIRTQNRRTGQAVGYGRAHGCAFAVDTQLLLACASN
jgi:hypothetical protein